MAGLNSIIDPQTGKQWDLDSLLKRVVELQDSLLKIQEQNLLLSAQARDAQDLKTELNNQNQLLIDKSRENKHVHQELSRLAGFMESQSKELESCKSAIADLQHQLKTTQQERDLLADMLTKAEDTVREATRTARHGGTTILSALATNTGWLRYLKGK